jgi:hypothetical protein
VLLLLLQLQQTAVGTHLDALSHSKASLLAPLTTQMEVHNTVLYISLDTSFLSISDKVEGLHYMQPK